MRPIRSTFLFIKHLVRLYHTIRHLKWQQFFFRFYYPFKRIAYKSTHIQDCQYESALSHRSIDFPKFKYQQGIFNAMDNSFLLLNIRHQFVHSIDWDYAGNGMLWSFHLHYFDWLNDPEIDLEEALGTIIEYIDYKHKSKINEYSFPASIRIINWIKFCIHHQVNDRRIIDAIYQQSHRLAQFPEYEIMGNHLLENGFSLLWSGIYFNDINFLNQGQLIVSAQLKEQILADGAHFERSASYTSLLLRELLEVCFLLHSIKIEIDIIKILKYKSFKMLSHLFVMIKDAPFYPNFNDSNEQMSVPFAELDALAKQLHINYSSIKLSESGFVRFEGYDFHLIFNSGNITAHYQPGHAHADAFSFVLNWKGQPIIVDPAVSVYQASDRRLLERSTIMHNTVSVEACNSVDVWSSFRLGKRCAIKTLSKTFNSIEIEHNAFYCKYKIIHRRQLFCDSKKIEIIDKLIGWNGQDATVYLHFHPSVKVVQEEQSISAFNSVMMNEKISFKFKNIDFYIEEYAYSFGFNLTQKAQRLVGTIKNEQSQIIIEI